MSWPRVDPRDDGIRPAGLPDACFYCGRRVGELHDEECVVVTKLIEMRVRVDHAPGGALAGVWTREVPHFWGSEKCEFAYNESTWCASNLFDQKDDVKWDQEDQASAWEKLAQFHGRSEAGCLCGELRVEFLRVVDETPRRRLQSEETRV